MLFRTNASEPGRNHCPHTFHRQGSPTSDVRGVFLATEHLWPWQRAVSTLAGRDEGDRSDTVSELLVASVVWMQCKKLFSVLKKRASWIECDIIVKQFNQRLLYNIWLLTTVWMASCLLWVTSSVFPSPLLSCSIQCKHRLPQKWELVEIIFVSAAVWAVSSTKTKT